MNKNNSRRKYTKEFKDSILKDWSPRIVNKPQYADLVPSQIVPKLASEGKYIASESLFKTII